MESIRCGQCEAVLFRVSPETLRGTLVTACQREDDQVFLTDVPRGTFITGPSRTVRRADALAWMAERLFESGDAPALASDRHEIVVHVEAEVLADGRAGRCEIEHRTAIAAETVRRLCCDAGIVPVVDGPNGEPLSVGRRTRSIPPAVRRALSNRDRGCRFPGCPATHRLHGHHVKHWADGGETSLRQPHPAVSDPSPAGARRRIRRTAPRRRRVPVHQSTRVGHPAPAAAGALIARHHRHPERIPRTRHRLRDRGGALARGAHRLRSCADGDDGVMGFGRHPPGGWAGGRRLESVVDRLREQVPAGMRHRRGVSSFVQPTHRVDAADPPEAIRCGADCRWDGDVGRQVTPRPGICLAIGRRDAGLSFVISY